MDITHDDSVVHWRTADVAAPDRIDAWSAMLAQSHLPWQLGRAPDAGFSACVAMRQFSGYRLIRCTCDAVRGSRQAAQISQPGERALSLLYVRQGNEVITIDDHELVLQPGDLVLWDSERPMTFNVPGSLEKLTLMFPEHAITGLFPAADAYVGRVVSRHRGLSNVLTGYLDSIERELWSMTPQDLTAAMKPTMELLATVLTTESKLPPRSIKSITLNRVKQYIIDHLDDCELSPGDIAGAIGITTRYLHLVFEDTGTTVSQWIKERRLERCREEIGLSPMTRRSISEIAYGWGFNHLSHFSKSFKHRYGVSPREYQRSLKAART